MKLYDLNHNSIIYLIIRTLLKKILLIHGNLLEKAALLYHKTAYYFLLPVTIAFAQDFQTFGKKILNDEAGLALFLSFLNKDRHYPKHPDKLL